MTRNCYMFRNAAAFGVALLFLGVAAAQPPSIGKDDKKNPGDKKAPPKDAPAKPDPAVDAWVKVLTEKIADKNNAVRDSAGAALVALGPVALPALKKLADGDDKASASAAKGLIAKIDNTPQRGPGGQGRFQGFPGGRDTGGLLDRVTKDLELTDKQKDKVKEIFSAYEKLTRDAFEKLRDGGRPDFEKIRASMKTLKDGLLNDLKGVLSAEQLKKVEKALDSGPGFFRRGPGGDRPERGGPPDGRGAPSGAGFLEQALKGLDLTDKQKDQIKIISANHTKKITELLGKGRDAEALKKAHDDLLKELKGVLSDEQFKKFEKAFQQGGPGQPNERRPSRDF